MKIKISRNWSIKEAMDKHLFKNVENGILGLKKLYFDVQQINILKKSGYISDDPEEAFEEYKKFKKADILI